MPERVPRTGMPLQDPQERIHNFYEVALGYTEEMAVIEANRCLMCKKPVCVEGCPVEIDIPAFIEKIQNKDFRGAYDEIKQDNALPAICGRVCPQESQCEKLCVLGKKFEPVAVGRLERYVADLALKEDNFKPTGKYSVTKKEKVAIVGSGPAGLTVAGDLVQMGYGVTVFEAFHVFGGVLVYGIPEFRLPNQIVEAEISYLETLGVEMIRNFVVGRSATIYDLFEQGYSAVFLGTGAGLPSFLKVPGENANGVFSSNEFLTRNNLMSGYKFPEYDTPMYCGKRVAVFGGGNTAMDSVRSSLRLGADKAMILYRRSETELPAREEEYVNAQEEGVEFHFLVSPLSFDADENGWVKSVKLQQMELGEPDDSGRRRPVPIEGKIYDLEIDTAVIAIGTRPNPLLLRTTPELETTRWGTVVVDESTMVTKMEGVYAGGDIVTGGATVISAMGAGKVAARAIDAYIQSKS